MTKNNKFYCNICEQDVVLDNGYCPICYTNWEKKIKDAARVDNISALDIRSNIAFHLRWGSIFKIICFIFAILVGISSLVLIGATGAISLSWLVLVPIIIFFGIHIEQNYKCKAYVLYTNMKK